MKNLLLSFAVFCAVGFSGVAHAASVPAVWTQQTVSMFYASMDSSYSCDYYQAQIEKALATLGARNVSVTCFGGLPYEWNVSANVTFTAAVPFDGAQTSANFQDTLIAGSESCDVNHSIVQQLLPKFATQNVKDDTMCGPDESQGTYKVSLQVLK